MSMDEKIIQAKADYDAVYEAGYDKGKAEGGDSFYDAFWDRYQNNGQPANYQYAFGRERFDDSNYNPKYPIVPNSENGAGNHIFYGSNITDTKVPIDLTGVTKDSGASGMLYYCYYLKTVNMIIVNETSPNITVYECGQLRNVTIEGSFARNFDIGGCTVLKRDSILSIYNSLSANATGKTCTFSKTAVNKAFETSDGAKDGSTSAEWEAMKAAKSNWTFALA